ncbi:MAG TPA: carboxy terminal-processing peptidase [Verrucomicrobiae bacterium]|nr:carboxy terminal-processing peptidase [Verrucomicrobiae bacterium]
MRHLKIKTLAVGTSLLLLGFPLLIQLIAGPATTATTPESLAPGPNDARIAYVTARLLEEFHYLQQPLDAEMSERFLDGYLQTLDPRRENFLQSDIASFAHFRTNLDHLTITTNGLADLTPAFEIYDRYLERLREHNAYVEEQLKQDKFKFTGDDRIQIDRRQAPYPKDLDEAKKLWRDQLRYQYLQEKLAREISPTNSNILMPLTKSNLTGIAETLAKHYRWNFHMATNWDSTDVLQAYLNGLAHAYDPHTDYLNNAHAQDFSINMSLSLFGIGAQLTEDDGYCTISKLLRGGPADKSKLLNEKDRIVAVSQGAKPPVDVVDMELGKVVQLIRGPKGTEVRLTISPADDRTARKVVTLVRDEIKLEDSEAKAKLIEMPNARGGTDRIGVIDLPSFYATIDLPGSSNHSSKSTTTDVAKLIKKLKQEKVDGIVLDLRSNPGGSLEEAVKFTGLFIKDGPVVLARTPDGNVNVDSDTDSSQLYSGPLVVLVNRFSASAAEIAAAALQDYGRAVIIGDTSTHGKGTVQNLNPLRPFISTATNDPGTVKITIRKFYRVSGASTQLKGVVPDIILPDVLNYSPDIGESSQDNPLPWDTIPSARYDKLNMVEPYLGDLRQHSDARVMTNQDFAYIQQDIQQFKKMQADKTASLNEKDQIKERQSNQARQKARDKERESRKTSGAKVYEITVKNSELPGLPDPLGTMTVNSASVTNTAKASVEPATSATVGSTDTITEAVDKKSPPPVDPALDETQHILQDYIKLLAAGRTLIAQ